jgi:hypothetical protein
MNIARTFSIFFFIISGCDSSSPNPDVKIAIGKDYERIIFNGYKVFRANSSQISIVDNSSNILVGPSVALYSHKYPFIFGEVHESDWEKISDKPGYFLIDANAGIIRKGLTQSEWTDALRLNGITAPPKLRKP